MSIEDESKIKFIPDITEEFNHYIGNALVKVTSIHQGAFDEIPPEQQTEMVAEAKADFITRIDELLSSEFNQTDKLTKASIAQFKSIAEKVDWNDPSKFSLVVALFEKLRAEKQEGIAA